MEVKFIEFDIKGDERGKLIALEQFKNIPFEIKRVYYIYNLKNNIPRGFHAHKNLQQVAICIRGGCKFLLDNGKEKVKDIILDSPNKGLFIDKMIWHEMYDFSEDCVLIVLASDYYDESDYIRDYEEFLKFQKGEE
ncbi:FdtA/QdtA family cupin domain-containing protein [Hydrogenivirga sp. 128-5-R1-1]|uniref:WxcM-like domain-containing protein n=1 Tax=Hydrogenivirga sp. 128-5-R1-1 TaxID=392423 RepID=UPI000300D3B3